MEEQLPRTCKVHFEDHNQLHLFALTIAPEDGFWSGGKFKFYVNVPEEYNIVVSSQFDLQLFLIFIYY